MKVAILNFVQGAIPKEMSDVVRELVSSALTFWLILFGTLRMTLQYFSNKPPSGLRIIVLIGIIFVTFSVMSMNLQASPNAFELLKINGTTSVSEARQKVEDYLDLIDREHEIANYHWALELRESFEYDYYRKRDLYIRYGEAFDLLTTGPVSPDAIESLEYSAGKEVILMYLMLLLLVVAYEITFPPPLPIKHLFTILGFFFILVVEIVFSDSLEEEGEDPFTVCGGLRELLDRPYATHALLRMWVRQLLVAVYLLSSFALELYVDSIQERFILQISKYAKLVNLEVLLVKKGQRGSVRDTKTQLQKVFDLLPRLLGTRHHELKKINHQNLSVEPGWMSYLFFWIINLLDFTHRKQLGQAKN
jgi:hypothetical protein